MNRKDATPIMAMLLKERGFDYVAEHKFHPTRRWRFDFALPELMLAIEIEGGGWSGGRHTTGAGFAKDLEKYDAAMRLGWTVYRCSPDMVRNAVAIETIEILRGIQRDRFSSIAGKGAAECIEDAGASGKG